MRPNARAFVLLLGASAARLAIADLGPWGGTGFVDNPQRAVARKKLTEPFKEDDARDRRIVRGGPQATRRRRGRGRIARRGPAAGCHADIPRRQVAAPPRGATWIFRGGRSRSSADTAGSTATSTIATTPACAGWSRRAGLYAGSTGPRPPGASRARTPLWSRSSARRRRPCPRRRPARGPRGEPGRGDATFCGTLRRRRDVCGSSCAGRGAGRGPAAGAAWIFRRAGPAPPRGRRKQSSTLLAALDCWYQRRSPSAEPPPAGPVYQPSANPTSQPVPEPTPREGRAEIGGVAATRSRRGRDADIRGDETPAAGTRIFVETRRGAAAAADEKIPCRQATGRRDLSSQVRRTRLLNSQRRNRLSRCRSTNRLCNRVHGPRRNRQRIPLGDRRRRAPPLSRRLRSRRGIRRPTPPGRPSSRRRLRRRLPTRPRTFRRTRRPSSPRSASPRADRGEPRRRRGRARGSSAARSGRAALVNPRTGRSGAAGGSRTRAKRAHRPHAVPDDVSDAEADGLLRRRLHRVLRFELVEHFGQPELYVRVGQSQQTDPLHTA